MKSTEKTRERIAANKAYLAKARYDALDAVGDLEKLLTSRGTRTTQLALAAAKTHHATGRLQDIAQRLVEARSDLGRAKAVRS